MPASITCCWKGRFAFSFSDATQDSRLPAGAKVLIAQVNDETRAYPLRAEGLQAWPDVVGGERILVLLDSSVAGGGVFLPVSAGQPVHIVVRDGQFVDKETGSVWGLGGRSVSGPIAGAELPPLPTKISFWYAAVAANPDIQVYLGE